MPFLPAAQPCLAGAVCSWCVTHLMVPVRASAGAAYTDTRHGRDDGPGSAGADSRHAVSLPLTDATGHQEVPWLQGAICSAFPLVPSTGARCPCLLYPLRMLTGLCHPLPYFGQKAKLLWGFAGHFERCKPPPPHGCWLCSMSSS